MQLAADGRHVAAAIDNMLVSSGPAAALALAHGARASTDITGFGLLGHLLEMLGPELGASLSLARLPLLEGALAAVERGIVSTLHESNAEAAAVLQRRDPVDDARLQMLFDPQTSGGLLIGVAPDTASRLCDELRRGGYPEAVIIGEVTAGGPGGRVVVS